MTEDGFQPVPPVGRSVARLDAEAKVRGREANRVKREAGDGRQRRLL